MPMKKTMQAEIPNDVSLSAVRDAIYAALMALMPDATYPCLDVVECYPDRVVVRDAAGELWQYPYTITSGGGAAGGTVTLGTRSAVEIRYVPSQEDQAQQSRLREIVEAQLNVARAQTAGCGDIRIMQAVDKGGWEWEVLIIKPGLGGNGQYFPPETLQQCAPVFEGARVFCLDDAQHTKGDKSAKQIVGWLDQARFVAGKGVVGRLHLMPTADWLRQNLLDSHAKGKPDLYGLSVDAPGEAVMKQVRELGDKLVQWFTKILSPATVDVVWNPGTPGGFQRALNAISVSASQKEERQMLEKLLKILQAKRPDLHARIDPAAITEGQVLALLEEGVVAQAQQGASLSDADKAVLKQARVMQWNGLVREQIDGSNLPEVMQADLRARFMDEPPAEPFEKAIEKVKQGVTAERTKLDKLGEEGKIKGLGTAHEVTTEGEAERLQQAMDKLFGLKDVKGDAPAFTGLRQAYERITGDVGVSGVRSSWDEGRQRRMVQAMRAFQANLGLDADGNPKEGFVRIEQSQVASGWPLILGNTMSRRLSMDYAEVDYGESRIISNKRRANDFRTLEVVRPQLPADLPAVNPETGDYAEAATLSEEGVNYVPTQRGRIMTISRKTILNDDLGAVIRIVRNEGRAARRTHARFVWNFFMANATYDGDALAWFHATHANLGSVALTADATGVTEMVAALQRLMDMTEPGSGEKLGGAWWNNEITLAVPSSLQAKAKQINQSQGIPGAANQGDNPVYGIFGDPDKPDRIVVNPLFTDVTDWGLFRSPREVEIIEVAYLMGQETPEVFVADQQTIGQMFVADKSQFKIRHEYGGELVDYRGAQKNVVAG